MTTNLPSDKETNEVLGRIMAQRTKFPGFLSSRVDPAVAEDILQSAYIKAMQHAGEIRDDESAVAWFYRILRNAITDSYRRQSARTRAQYSFAAEVPTSYEPELEQTVCACIGDVIQDLKSEYREAIQQVDLDGVSVQAFAASQGTSANNASAASSGEEGPGQKAHFRLRGLRRTQKSRLHLSAQPTVRPRWILRQQH